MHCRADPVNLRALNLSSGLIVLFPIHSFYISLSFSSCELHLIDMMGTPLPSTSTTRCSVVFYTDLFCFRFYFHSRIYICFSWLCAPAASKMAVKMVFCSKFFLFVFYLFLSLSPVSSSAHVRDNTKTESSRSTPTEGWRYSEQQWFSTAKCTNSSSRKLHMRCIKCRRRWWK